MDLARKAAVLHRRLKLSSRVSVLYAHNINRDWWRYSSSQRTVYLVTPLAEAAGYANAVKGRSLVHSGSMNFLKRTLSNGFQAAKDAAKEVLGMNVSALFHRPRRLQLL